MGNDELLSVIQGFREDIREFRRESSEHRENLNLKVDSLSDKVSDCQQSVSSIQHIFAPNGPFQQMEKQVKDNSNFILKLKTIGGLFGSGTVLSGLYDYFKHHRQ